MLLFRIYIALLTLIFLAVNLSAGRFGFLEGTISIGALLFLILDVKSDVQDLKNLDEQVASLSNGG